MSLLISLVKNEERKIGCYFEGSPEYDCKKCAVVLIGDRFLCEIHAQQLISELVLARANRWNPYPSVNN